MRSALNAVVLVTLTTINYHTVVVHSFLSPFTQTARRFSSLSYTNDPKSPRPVGQVLTIPVLGPIPGGSPLVIGEDFLLEQPTPLQWNVLEEAMHHHRQHAKQQREESSHLKVAGIDAAPLVAFMDDVTSMYSIPGDRSNAKYATVAAVVGISSDLGDDTSSSEGFMESIMRVFRPDQKDTVRPLESSSIRLVGIGRAALSNFYSRIPSSYYEEQQDEDGYLVLSEQQEHDNAKTPIMMAQFRLLTDTAERSSAFVDDFGGSARSSPVHALSEMGNLASRITSLHEDRKALVRGLQAAKARLAVAAKADELEDHDGLGMLSSGFQAVNGGNNQQQQQQDIATLLSDFPVGAESLFPRKKNSHEQLLEMENYGMGISSASFSAIPGLTKALAEKLRPYHSPEKQATEEHYYEVFSFMGVLSVNKFVPATDLDSALKCTNTIERMKWLYETMWSHKNLLRDACEEVSQELRDCGEECTDLW
ncbi:expressed unknown protein [Seminavis robusta]|uniref:Uncharacterized protein n=1 Tax=Seminavis robusta TaxID=568900 RepID=A0A9N8HIT7_9STRA|nr:expressed unknown protein [Seminavis robusta]|eukprot:Sro616_g176020.1 n/a (479) ;mRNA; r:40991-42427